MTLLLNAWGVKISVKGLESDNMLLVKTLITLPFMEKSGSVQFIKKTKMERIKKTTMSYQD